jgi:hypothetical protein
MTWLMDKRTLYNGTSAYACWLLRDFRNQWEEEENYDDDHDDDDDDNNIIIILYYYIILLLIWYRVQY